METNNYSVLYQKNEGIYFYFKRYVLHNILPFFLIIFIILNSILLFAFLQWQDSNITIKKNIYMAINYQLFFMRF